MSSVNKLIDVAVAVLQQSDGRVLWSSRPEGKPYAGYWEFPGGKLEAGESVWQALVREIHEELGIQAIEGGPWVVITHEYPHAHVRLHFYRVWEFEGMAHGKEGQLFRWGDLSTQDPLIQPILPATLPLLKSLSLPTHMWLTDFSSHGLDQGMDRLDRALQVNPQIKPIIQFREKNLDAVDQSSAIERLMQWANTHQLTVLINSDCQGALQAAQDLSKTNRDGRWGVHWTESAILAEDAAQTLSAFEGLIQTGSVHCQNSLKQAARLGLHAAVLGTVKPSQTHPGGDVLGWEQFSAMVQDTPIPVYAIGGLSLSDLKTAAIAGAHGIALQRGWSEGAELKVET